MGLLTCLMQAHALGWDISLIHPIMPSTASTSRSTFLTNWLAMTRTGRPCICIRSWADVRLSCGVKWKRVVQSAQGTSNSSSSGSASIILNVVY
ncbi:hypothetical protein BJV78DRAFT_1204416 [Lactifluus subvellereus]|nr:hypothetical protein BJV78DRAFT_1204416 [Lactifluus subvellereus]